MLKMKSRTKTVAAERTMDQVYRAARAYLRAGLSLIPITADGEKRPAWLLMSPVWSSSARKMTYPWSPFKSRRPTPAEVRSWFADPDDDQEYGLAIIGGAVSGGLEIIDCDNWEVAKEWTRLVMKKRPELIDSLVLVRSPRPGLHVYYRCAEFGGNQKLARIPDAAKDNLEPKTIIEIKGEGGYCLAPPSPASCHPTGKRYRFLNDKDLTEIPMISPADREVLLRCARKLNRWHEPQRPSYPQVRRRILYGKTVRPGDDLNQRADWAEILEPHGWQWAGRGGDGSDRWRRPGKSASSSATTNYGGSDLLYVFSTSAYPFDEGTGYTKFHAYALLNHDGDFSRAARALTSLGYGGRRRRSRRHRGPFERYAQFSAKVPADYR